MRRSLPIGLALVTASCLLAGCSVVAGEVSQAISALGASAEKPADATDPVSSESWQSVPAQPQDYRPLLEGMPVPGPRVVEWTTEAPWDPCNPELLEAVAKDLGLVRVPELRSILPEQTKCILEPDDQTDETEVLWIYDISLASWSISSIDRRDHSYYGELNGVTVYQRFSAEHFHHCDLVFESNLGVVYVGAGRLQTSEYEPGTLECEHSRRILEHFWGNVSLTS